MLYKRSVKKKKKQFLQSLEMFISKKAEQAK